MTLCDQQLPSLKSLQGPFFSRDELVHLQPPKHVAIMPDGNRRWAQQRGEPHVEGYLAGTQKLIQAALAAKELGIGVLTMYAFSTENWKRSPDEIDLLMHLFDLHLNFYAQSLLESDIRVHVIGKREELPLFLQETIEHVCALTSPAKGLDFVLAINYGGRDDIVRAVNSLLQNGVQEVTEKTLHAALDTACWPDPDLVIRTSGEKRFSNFLLWQLSYSEWLTPHKHWPDFTPHDLLLALTNYQQRSRRYGGS